jgi:polysaccharide biosynthesis transport protein
MNDTSPLGNSLIGRQIRSRRALAAAGDALLRGSAANDAGHASPETQRVDGAPPPLLQVAEPPQPADGAAARSRLVRREPPRIAGAEAPWRPLIDPRAVVRALISARRLIIATSILGFVGASLFATTLPKHFYSTVDILVDPRDLRISDRDLLASGLPYDASLALVENQTRILTSRRVLERTVDTLNLDQDGEFNGRGTGAPDMLRSLRTAIFGSAADDPARAREIAIETLTESIGVSRAAKTFVLNVSVRSEDAAKSALIANTMADAFLAVQNEIQVGTVSRANTEIGGKLDELRADVEKAERLVEAYKSENELFDANGKLISDDEIMLASTQLTRAREKVAELRSRADSARQLTLDQVLSDALPEGAASNLIGELRREYAQKVQQVDALAQKLGDQHPQLKTAQAEAASSARAIEIELRRLSQTAQIELQRAVQTEQELAASQARLKSRQTDISDRLVRLRELEREAAARRNVYEGFLLRARETGEQAGISTANITIVSQAVPALRSYGVSRKLVAAGGLIAGFMAGVMLALAGALWRALTTGHDDELVAAEAAGNARHEEGGDPDPAGPGGPEGGGRRMQQENGRRDMVWTPAGWVQPQMQPHPYMVPMPQAVMPQAVMPQAVMPQMMQPMMAPVMMPHMMQPHMMQPVMTPQMMNPYMQPVMQPQMMQPVMPSPMMQPQYAQPHMMQPHMMQPQMMPQPAPQPAPEPAPQGAAEASIRSRIGALRDGVVSLAATRQKLARLG